MNLENPVTVVGDEAGSVINPTRNPLKGYIKVIQNRAIFDNNGSFRFKPVSAIIHGTIDDLKKLSYRAGEEIEGKIVIEEQLQPFNPNNPDYHIKKAGDTGIICSIAGNPIYRRTLYTDSLSAEDTLIQHDNVDELRAAYNLQQESVSDESASASEDFEL